MKRVCNIFLKIYLHTNIMNLKIMLTLKTELVLVLHSSCTYTFIVKVNTKYFIQYFIVIHFNETVL